MTTIAALIVGIRLYLRKLSLKDKKELDPNWSAFIQAVDESNMANIDEYGSKLILNKHLTGTQLTKIIEVVDSNIEDFPELEQLKLNAFNKKLHYDRPLPTQGGYTTTL